MTSNATPTDALAGKLKRTELQHSASSIAGREILQVLTEIPAGVESGWHQHPGETGMMLSTYIVEAGEPVATFTR
jgi:quercetin dioxygenase-like cupin family protein